MLLIDKAIRYCMIVVNLKLGRIETNKAEINKVVRMLDILIRKIAERCIIEIPYKDINKVTTKEVQKEYRGNKRYI